MYMANLHKSIGHFEILSLEDINLTILDEDIKGCIVDFYKILNQCVIV